MAKPVNAADQRKIAVYVRKSKITESGKSIEIQKEKCASLAAAQLGAAAEDIIFYEDEGRSGFYADRPRYMKMLADIEKNKIKAVVCYKIDRVSRRTVDLLNLVQQMDRKGIAFISVSDRDIDTSTRTGKIMISLLAAIAEFERDIIAERIGDNMYELAKEGRWLGGECPLGYRSKREKLADVNGKKTAVNRLEPAEAEQQAVKKIFSVFLKLNSLTGTAAEVNAMGFKTKKGKDFTLTSVKNILQNPVYAAADPDMRRYFDSRNVTVWADASAFDGAYGVMAYNKTEQTKEIDAGSTALDPKYSRRTLRRDIRDWVVSVGKHKGIVSGRDWIRVQQTIEEISADHSARPRDVSKSLLSGLVRCPVCGGKMLARTNSGRYYPDGTLRFSYICTDKYRNRSTVCKYSPNLRGRELDDFVFAQICGLFAEAGLRVTEPAEVKKILAAKTLEREKEEEAVRKRLAQIEADIQSQTANLRRAPEDVKPLIFSDLETLSREREKIRDNHRPNRPKKIGGTGSVPAPQNILGGIAEKIKQTGYEEKLRLIRNVVGHVTVKNDTVHIFLKGAAKILQPY